MKGSKMALIEYMLEKLNCSDDFEKMCCQILYKSGYSDINPVGGSNDKGRDAVESLYENTEGSRKIVFQFSLEKTIKSKVKRTLTRLKECGIKPNQLIFIFNMKVSPKLRDDLIEFAIKEHHIDLDIKGQRYILMRLGLDNYKDIFQEYFGDEINRISELSKTGNILISEDTISDEEKRCLINLMYYSRHAISGDIKKQIITETISMIFVHNNQEISLAKIIKDARLALPKTIKDVEIQDVLSSLEKVKVLDKTEAGHYRITEANLEESRIAIAEIYTVQQEFHKDIFELCTKSPNYDLAYPETAKIVDVFLCELFRSYGHEVAHNILNYNSSSTEENPLDEENVEIILSKATASIKTIYANLLSDALKKLLTNPSTNSLQYLSALSTSYICMQLLNSNPDVLVFQKERIKDSVAVLDTDILLAGIVSGSRRSVLTKELVNIFKKSEIEYFAFKTSVEEIVFRIKRSIQLYYDLGCPSFIPLDKKDMIQDIFLDVFLQQIADGSTTSFDSFMERYYKVGDPNEHIENLLFEEFGIECRTKDKYYIIEQETKIRSIQEVIESNRMKSLSFKNSDLYYRDAKAMVVIEQQNREKIKEGLPGRWYLISGDKHILNAYLTKKGSFKTKPCILPRHFIEMLRQMPENVLCSSAFGSILKSEVFMRGPGKNYTTIIASMTKLGVKALDYSRVQLLELFDEMERSDFTSWLIKLRGYKNLPEKLKEDITNGLERLFDESASRSQVMEDLKMTKIPSS